MVEECSWLDIWSHGHLRQQRESTWYLGLNMGDDYYMVAYCRMEGQISIEKTLVTFFGKDAAFKSKVKSKEHGSQI